MKRGVKLILLFCAIFFAGQWIKSDPFRIVGAAFLFLICGICAIFYLLFPMVIGRIFSSGWLVIKKCFHFLLALAIIFLPLILGFIFHIKEWWLWVLFGIIQIIFILLGLVIFGGLASDRALNNSDGY